MLLVDDDTALLELGAYMVRKLGHEVLTAQNGVEAEAMAMVEEPDVVLLDVLLPVQDGFETLKHLRELAFKGVVILTSALLATTVEMKAEKLGGAIYLQKPFTSAKLAEMLSATEGKV